MKLQKLLCLILSLALTAAVLTACGDQEQPSDPDDTQSTVSTASDAGIARQELIASDETLGFQLEKPAAGEEVALLHTNYGDIYIRLFPAIAAKAVENFKGLIQKGYYNNLIFHRVIQGFCVQGGDPKGDGTGGESLWGEPFEDEFSDKLLNLSYSVSMANSGANTNGSQFFINHGSPSGFDRASYQYETLYANYSSYYQQYCNYYSDFTTYYPDLDSFISDYIGGISPDSRLVPEEVWRLYEENGGNISLDGAWRASGGHTVFGQVYAGQDVVDAIAAVQVDENDKPVKDVVIQSAEIITVS